VVGANESVIVGLPDTIWFPEDALTALPDVDLSFLLFPVDQPELFDAVVLDGDRVTEIQVKQPNAQSHWIWGAFKMSAATFEDLRLLWKARERRDEYFGTLVNSYLQAGGKAIGVKAGTAYVDVGTIHGYRMALSLLMQRRQDAPLMRGNGGEPDNVATNAKGPA
jgi:glucose-1-phosphate thymidylyltransferase